MTQFQSLLVEYDKMGEILQDFFTWHANHFEDFDSATNAELLTLANRAEVALAKWKPE